MKVIVRGNPVKVSKSKGGISTETVIVKMRKGTSDVTKIISDGYDGF